ncbi:MAG: phosphonate C-P lyase system protein PhnH [Pseudomonadota bacterium]
MTAAPSSPTSTALKGFADPIHGAQDAFRTCLRAMSRPGMILALAGPAHVPAPLTAASAAILLTLADFETQVWLDPAAQQSEPLVQFLKFNTAAPLTDTPADAAFALVTDPTRAPRFECFAQGSLDYPDRSTTLILQVARLHNDGAAFEGPGIDGTVRLGVEPAPLAFADQWRENRHRSPCGVDLIFATPTHIAALPRSARLKERGA